MESLQRFFGFLFWGLTVVGVSKISNTYCLKHILTTLTIFAKVLEKSVLRNNSLEYPRKAVKNHVENACQNTSWPILLEILGSHNPLWNYHLHRNNYEQQKEIPGFGILPLLTYESQGGPGSVRFGYGLGVERFEHCGGSAGERVSLCLGTVLTGKDGSGSGSVPEKRFQRFRFCFPFRGKRFRQFRFAVPVRFLGHRGKRKQKRISGILLIHIVSVACCCGCYVPNMIIAKAIAKENQGEFLCLSIAKAKANKISRFFHL